jgi:hypothetical protein
MAVRWHNGNNAGLRNLGLSIDGHLTLNHFVSSLSSGAGSRLYRECEQQAGLKQERATWRLPSLYDLL